MTDEERTARPSGLPVRRDLVESALLGGLIAGLGVLIADLVVFAAMGAGAGTGAYAAFVFGVGFVLGLEHATDADHVVAVSTIVSEHGSLRKSAAIGVTWGLGHTTTLLILGLVVLLAKVTIPPRVTLVMEFLVGVLLVVLGFSVAKSFLRAKLHLHRHAHAGVEHEHPHVHHAREEHAHRHAALSHKRKSFLVGMVHGVAGSAALAILVLATIDSVLMGLAYILVFGAGSILGMLFISSLIGIPFTYTANRLKRFNETIRVVAGLVSMGLGVFIMAETALLSGLFG